jgi:peptide/nickel transport system substrate-binding protein
MKCRHVVFISAALMLTLLAGTVFATGTQEVQRTAVERTGAWLDEVVFLQESSFAAGVSRLQAGEIQVYAHAIAEPELYRRITADANLGFETSYGLYDEITFNPIGPTFPATGKLNPFSVPRIREAMNWLVDRTFVAEEIYGGLANPRWTAVNTAFPDYTRLIEINRKMELVYAYDFDQANRIITEEMQKLGARKVNNVWQYQNEPVTLIGLIRTEDARRDIGDYVANQLERLGFRTQREYKTGAEASPIWISGDPAAGLFHFYTGGWVSTSISRDLAGNFDFFYTPRGLTFPLWQAYKPSAEFDTIAERLANSDFQTVAQRAELFAQALELSMKDSIRIFVTDRIGVAPRRTNVAVAADLSASISGAFLWPHTIRFTDRIGGRMTIGLPSMLPEPWNPLGGSNWVYDQMIIRSTQDYATLPDPYTGLAWPQRVERAEVTIKQGLPVSRTHDWVTLSFANEISVPADAWIDWDPQGQRFITVGTKHPGGLTANRKSVAYFEPGLLNRQWHDGSAFSVADMVLSLILTFDRANPESAIYDEATRPSFESFQRTFKGARIVSTNPVVIEYYSDIFTPDAETNVTTLFPAYGFGPGAWHTLGVAMRAEANKQLAFSKAKADKLEVEWTNMIAGPAIDILKSNMTAARSESMIPYRNTLGQFITAADASQRWQNLNRWVEDKGHFWVGLGPYYLERAFPVEKSAQIQRFEGYGDSPEKWARFDAPRIADVDVSGPPRVTAGQPATFDVSVTFGGRPYAVTDMESVKYLLFNARGELVKVGDAASVADGRWRISLSAAETRSLPAGSNRLEVAVAPTIVSVPSFDSLLFATVAQ